MDTIYPDIGEHMYCRVHMQKSETLPLDLKSYF